MINRGVASVRAALDGMDQENRILVFSRLLREIDHPSALIPLEVLGDRAASQASKIKAKEHRFYQELANPIVQSRGAAIVLKEAAA